MTHKLAFERFMFDDKTSLGTKLSKADDVEIGYIVELDLNYLDKIKRKQVVCLFV